MALFSVLFGESEIALFVNNLDKHVKKYVTDDLRKEEALTAIENYLDNVDAHKDRRKGYNKELNAMLVDPLITRASFDAFTESVLIAREEIQIAYVRLRVDIAASITEDEWQAILGAGRKSYAKEFKKKQKSKESIDKELDKVEASIIKHYNTADHKRMAREILDEFNSVTKDLVQQTADYNLYESQELMSRIVNYDDFLLLLVESNVARDMVYDLFVDTYFDLKEIATREEWPSIAKEFKKYY